MATSTPILDAINRALRTCGQENTLVASDFPSRREEAYKWSDLRKAINGFQQTQPQIVTPSSVEGPLLTLENGSMRLENSLQTYRHELKESLRPEIDSRLEVLAHQTARPDQRLRLEVKQTPVDIWHFNFANNETYASALIEVDIDEGQNLTVFETYLPNCGYSNVVLRYKLQKQAQLNRIIYAPKAHGILTSNAHIELYEGAEVTQTLKADGGYFQRIETLIDHKSGASKAILRGAYNIKAGRHHDATSLVRHMVPSCMTDQSAKGVASDKAIGIFQGKFFVAKDAQSTEAEMLHQAMLLDDSAEIKAKPELEIYADDVECAHGNTIGGVDEDALFYMRQRGLDKATAKAMLIEAFLNTQYEYVPEALKPYLGISSEA